MTLAQDLALLLLDDEGAPATKRSTDGLLAAALMFELAVLARLELFDSEHRLFVQDGSATGDPLLDHALTTLAPTDGSRVPEALGVLAVGLADRVHTGLAEAGAVRRHTQRKLFRTSTTWPPDQARRAAVRAPLAEALTGNREPEERTALMVVFLHGAELLSLAGTAPDRVTARAEEIAEALWARRPELELFADKVFEGSGEAVIPMI